MNLCGRWISRCYGFRGDDRGTYKSVTEFVFVLLDLNRFWPAML